MKYIQQILTCATLALSGYAFQPAMAQVKLPSDAYPVIVAPHHQAISYRERTLCYDITTNVDFTATTDADWITVSKGTDGTVYIHLKENPGNALRTGKVVFANAKNNITETLTITQTKNEGLSDLTNDDLTSIFTDQSLSALKDGVTKEQINEKIKNKYYKKLALGILDGTYDKTCRAQTYTAKLNPTVQSNIWNAPGKLYDQRQGVTGINITKGKQTVAVSGLPEGKTVNIIVTAWYEGHDGGNFDGGNPVSFTYPVKNGLNVIDYSFNYDGLAYVCYYADANPQLQPAINVHFIDGQINGFLSPDKTNEEMHEITANAKNICMDVVGKKVHSVWTSKGLHDYCKAVKKNPDDRNEERVLGYRQYMNVLDSLIQWEHDLLGFKKYNSEPDNRTMAYTNYTYYMFQGGFGVSFHHDQEPRVLDCNTLVYKDNDAIWGLSHEWGHQHQMHPYFCWGGMAEVTNNMNSYYNIMKMGYHESDKINQWAAARKHFVDADYSDIHTASGDLGLTNSRYSRKRSLAYQKRSTQPNEALRAFCETMSDSTITDYAKNSQKALALVEQQSVNKKTDAATGVVSYGYSDYVGETLCPFIMLYNYFTTHGKPDFAPDWYEALRQTDNENGSIIEKQDGLDKYEALAAAQNYNKNGKYNVFSSKYPQSVWVTKKYVTASSSPVQNTMPFVLNYIRKVSRLSGYNLFPYFERWGYLRTVALYIGDYGNYFSVFTPEMYDEFKADMDALVANGTLKEMPSGMVEEISNTADLCNSGYKDFGKTPVFPN